MTRSTSSTAFSPRAAVSTTPPISLAPDGLDTGGIVSDVDTTSAATAHHRPVRSPMPWFWTDDLARTRERINQVVTGITTHTFDCTSRTVFSTRNVAVVFGSGTGRKSRLNMSVRSSRMRTRNGSRCRGCR